MKKKPPMEGFTLMEMVIVLAIIAVLAAILTPVITSYVDRARLNSARTNVKNIAAAIAQFDTDLKFYPIYKTGGVLPAPATAGAWDFEATDGADAAYTGSGWATLTDTSGNLQLNMNTNFYAAPSSGPGGKQIYRGPYVELGPDPWGGRYYLTSKNLTPGNPNFAAYVISAGPNQTIETDFAQDRTGTSDFVIGGDDIVARIR
jgi:prepilin-type N-terminal cleavage/methylation domain-containing protein